MVTTIDERLLTDDEAAAYGRLRAGELPSRDRWPVTATIVAAGTAWVAVVVILLWSALTLMKTDQGGLADDAVGILALVVALGGWIPVRRAGRSALESARKAALDRFVSGIPWAERRAEAAASREDTGGTFRSTRQRQHDWYEGHSELTWRDRQIGEMYGMDVDTYINNYKEAD